MVFPQEFLAEDSVAMFAVCIDSICCFKVLAYSRRKWDSFRNKSMSLSKDIQGAESPLEQRLNQLEIDGINPFRVLVERNAFHFVKSLSLSKADGCRVHLAVMADSVELGSDQWFKEDYEPKELQRVLSKLIQHLLTENLSRVDEYNEWSTRLTGWFSDPKFSLALRANVRSSSFAAAAAKIRS